MFLGECQGACTLSALLRLFVRIFFVSPAFNIQAATCHMGGREGGVPSYDVIVIVIVSDQRHTVVQINTRLQSGFVLLVSVL